MIGRSEDDQWCDWCAEHFDGAPIRLDDRVFCCLTCVNAYRRVRPTSSGARP